MVNEKTFERYATGAIVGTAAMVLVEVLNPNASIKHLAAAIFSPVGMGLALDVVAKITFERAKE